MGWQEVADSVKGMKDKDKDDVYTRVLASDPEFMRLWQASGGNAKDPALLARANVLGVPLNKDFKLESKSGRPNVDHQNFFERHKKAIILTGLAAGGGIGLAAGLGAFGAGAAAGAGGAGAGAGAGAAGAAGAGAAGAAGAGAALPITTAGLTASGLGGLPITTAGLAGSGLGSVGAATLGSVPAAAGVAGAAGAGAAPSIAAKATGALKDTLVKEGIGLGTSALQGYLANRAINKGLEQQQAATDQALAVNDRTLGPYVQRGNTAGNALMGLMGLGPLPGQAGFNGSATPQGQAQTEPIAPTAQASGDFVPMRAPDGSVRRVPRVQVQEAMANGGQVVQ